MDIIFATGNMGKLREAGEILGTEFKLISSAQAGVVEDIPEDGDSLKQNSLFKAEYIFNKTGRDCFADDTGLEVDMLDGAPGVHTARYGSENGHDFEANMDRLLREMATKDASLPRTARFRSVITLMLGGNTHFFEGTIEGSIATTKYGSGGFGYDPVFIPNEIPGPDGKLIPNSGKLTLAEISEDDKNSISHRGKALRAMAKYLSSLR